MEPIDRIMIDYWAKNLKKTKHVLTFKRSIDLMSQAQRMHLLQDVFQMTAIVLVSIINHYNIKTFWNTLYIKWNIVKLVGKFHWFGLVWFGFMAYQTLGTITRYGYVWNIHECSYHIYIKYRNLETRKTLTTSGTKLFITFEFKGSST